MVSLVQKTLLQIYGHRWKQNRGCRNVFLFSLVKRSSGYNWNPSDQRNAITICSKLLTDLPDSHLHSNIPNSVSDDDGNDVSNGSDIFFKSFWWITWSLMEYWHQKRVMSDEKRRDENVLCLENLFLSFTLDVF